MAFQHLERFVNQIAQVLVVLLRVVNAIAAIHCV